MVTSVIVFPMQKKLLKLIKFEMSPSRRNDIAGWRPVSEAEWYFKWHGVNIITCKKKVSL